VRFGLQPSRTPIHASFLPCRGRHARDRRIRVAGDRAGTRQTANLRYHRRERHVHVRAAHASRSQHVPDRLRRARPQILAEPRRLRPRGNARHREDHARWQAPTPLHQQLARHPPLHLDADGAERLQGQVAQLVHLPAGVALRRPRLRGRRHRRALRPDLHARGRAREDRAQNARRRHDDEGRPGRAARAREDRDVRRRVAFPRSRARRRSHGTRWRPLRARAMVPARRRLRRRPRLEYRAVPRPG